MIFISRMLTSTVTFANLYYSGSIVDGGGNYVITIKLNDVNCQNLDIKRLLKSNKNKWKSGKKKQKKVFWIVLIWQRLKFVLRNKTFKYRLKKHL